MKSIAKILCYVLKFTDVYSMTWVINNNVLILKGWKIVRNYRICTVGRIIVHTLFKNLKVY